MLLDLCQQHQQKNKFVRILTDLDHYIQKQLNIGSHIAADVVKALSQVFSRFGPPNVILSDLHVTINANIIA